MCFLPSVSDMAFPPRYSRIPVASYIKFSAHARSLLGFLPLGLVIRAPVDTSLIPTVARVYWESWQRISTLLLVLAPFFEISRVLAMYVISKYFVPTCVKHFASYIGADYVSRGCAGVVPIRQLLIPWRVPCFSSAASERIDAVLSVDAPRCVRRGFIFPSRFAA